MRTLVNKVQWLDSIAADGSLPPASLRIATMLVSRYFNAATGEAWPSQARLCADLSISEDTTRRGVGALVAAGYLSVTPSKGRGHSTVYRIAQNGTSSDLPVNGEIPATLRGVDDPMPRSSAGCSDANSPQIEVGSPLISAQNTPQNCYPNLSKNLLKEPTEDSNPSIPFELVEQPKSRTTTAQADSFAAFWAAYPRRVGRGQAEKAWAAAIKGGVDPDDVIAGARRYGETRVAAEPDPVAREKFTAHPATWLNGKRWADEPAPSAASPSGGGLLIDGVTGLPIREPPPQRPPANRAEHIIASAFSYADLMDAAPKEPAR